MKNKIPSDLIGYYESGKGIGAMKVNGKTIYDGRAEIEENKINLDGGKTLYNWMKTIYGERCPEYEKGCSNCTAWNLYDRLIQKKPLVETEPKPLFNFIIETIKSKPMNDRKNWEHGFLIRHHHDGNFKKYLSSIKEKENV